MTQRHEIRRFTTFSGVEAIFFRIEDAEELTFIGMDELLDRDAIKFIEWSENVVSELPKPNIKVSLQVEGTGRYARVYENR